MPNEIKFQPRKWLTTVIGRKKPIQFPNNETEWHAILETASSNGVTALCHYQMMKTDLGDLCPDWFNEALKRHTLSIVAIEMLQERELQQVVRDFSNECIYPLFIKGTPLAYSLYPEPYLRERCDTDILFTSRDQAYLAQSVLQKRGYQRPSQVSGGDDSVWYQFSSYRTSRSGATYNLDMHWRLNNVHHFSKSFKFADLEKEAINISDLGENARSLGLVHSLLLACMHRAAHIPSGLANKLNWLYDVHLIISCFNENNWEEFKLLAWEKSIAEVCLDCLKATQSAFETTIPGSVLGELQRGSRNRGYQPQNAHRLWQILWMNFQFLPGWRAKLKWLSAHFFPAPEYMVRKYEIKHRSMLPAYYILRTLRGIPRAFNTLKNR